MKSYLLLSILLIESFGFAAPSKDNVTSSSNSIFGFTKKSESEEKKGKPSKKVEEIDVETPWNAPPAEVSIPERPFFFRLEGDYRNVWRQKITTHGKVKDSSVRYADSLSSLFYSHFLTSSDILSVQVGYNFVKFDWDKNPRFHQKDFHYGVASVSLASYSLDRWRWIVNFGGSLDLEILNFGKSAVYYGMAWGRYEYTSTIGLHIGFVGYVGVMNGYMIPILGFDWQFADKWKLNVLPLDFSIEYEIDKYFKATLAYSTFGGPYRYPRRAHGGEEGFHDAIFSIYARGLDLNLKFDYLSRVKAAVGAGWDFGGWIQIKNHHNRHSKYFRYDGAPYAQAKFEVSF